MQANSLLEREGKRGWIVMAENLTPRLTKFSSFFFFSFLNGVTKAFLISCDAIRHRP